MLTGPICQNIGCLKQLEFLDLSRNQFIDSIPANKNYLCFMSFLGLSYNKLLGKNPSGTQIQISNPSKFIVILHCVVLYLHISVPVMWNQMLSKLKVSKKSIKKMNMNFGNVFILVWGLDSKWVLKKIVN